MSYVYTNIYISYIPVCFIFHIFLSKDCKCLLSGTARDTPVERTSGLEVDFSLTLPKNMEILVMHVGKRKV